jgi:hypothetical protein
MLRNLFHALLGDRRPDLAINAVSDTRFEISDQAGNSVRFELDSSGLPLKRIFSSVGPAGPVEMEETLSDWRDVDGVRLPHKSVLTQGGKPAAESTIQEWKLNGGLKPEELSQKP